MDGSVDFEKALADLENLVQRMESNELPLADAMAEFERGISLVRSCQAHLEQARQQVAKWISEEGPADQSTETSN